MKFGTKLFVALLICGVVSQAQAIVTLQIASREAIDGTTLERLIVQMDTDGDPIQGLDLIITAPAGTVNQESFVTLTALFQDEAATLDGASPGFADRDTYWLFDESVVQAPSGSRVAPYAAFPLNGEGTTMGQSPDVDYLAGAIALPEPPPSGTATVVADHAPFTSRAIAQVVVQQGTQLTLAFGQVSDVNAAGAITVDGVGELITDVPEPAGLLMGVMSLGLLASRRRRRSA